MKKVIIASIFIAALFFGVSGVSAVFNNHSERVEILIGFEDSPSLITRARIRAQGWKIVNQLPQINVLVISLPALPDEADNVVVANRAEGILNRMSGITSVAYVEENGMMYAHDQTVPWGIERIGSLEAHSLSKGEGIGIAVLDTGIDPQHEDLNVAGGYAVIRCFPPARCAEFWDDDHGHGTHVAGTAAGLDNDVGVLGVAPKVNLYAVKVLDRQGGGTWAGVAEGIIWAADQGIEVINMSLGGGDSETVKNAVIHAYGKGSLLVASAGNSGPSEDTVGYPAAYSQVIAVSAVDENDNIASWSSRGEEVEFAAPGVRILSTVPKNKYEEKSGTSMSAPHVSGVAALVWATSSDLTNEEVRGILQQTAEDIELSDTQQGYGLIDAAGAVGVEPVDYGVRITPEEQTGIGSPGQTLEYVYTLFNIGTEDDTYNLQLIDTQWEASISEDSITLIAGESEDITVSHIIPEDAQDFDFDTGILTVNSDQASTEATFTTTVAVEPEPSGEISIQPVEWGTQGGRHNDRHLRIKLTLKDEERYVVVDATVGIDLEHDDGGSWSFSGTTNIDGEVTFGLNNAPNGRYELTVNGVSHQDLDWDGFQPENNEFTK